MRAMLPANHMLTPHSGAISGDSTPSTGEGCACCRGELKPRQKYCTPRCRLLHWAAKEIIKEYQAGHADGLKDFIDRMRA